MAEPDAGMVEFALDDPEHRLAGVHLEQELGIPDDELQFTRVNGRWLLALRPPPVQRIEYRLRLLHQDGGTETITDPGNPLLAPGAFGAKSVRQLPGYHAPAWLGRATPWPVGARLSVPTGVGPVDVELRSPPAAEGRLLLAHDGPEYDQLAELGAFAAAVVRSGRVPPFHLALAAPGARDERYSANPRYSAALATEVLPALRLAGPVVLMGASLGALAALHVQRRYPAAVDGLFLQSGSFLAPQYDERESNFRYYRRIIRYVSGVHRSARAAARAAGRPVPTVLTCGSVEENVHNNRLMAATLQRQGYPARLLEVPDAHNYTAWRDALDPHLVTLLGAVFGAGGDA
jgi:enterochelin esterase-like enzyme